MDPQNHVLQTRHDGTSYFASALEGTGDGGLTTFAPLVLGKILRADSVDTLLPSMAAYFNEEAGIFLDGTRRTLRILVSHERECLGIWRRPAAIDS